jgi:sporulation protein YlmC with PRC-barrel domain
MTLGDLIGRPVLSRSAKSVGEVIDVRLVGAEGADFPRLFVSGLIVGLSRRSRLLGYQPDDPSQPWLLRRLLRRMHAKTRFVPWAEVELVAEHVRLRRELEDFPRIGELD